MSNSLDDLIDELKAAGVQPPPKDERDSVPITDDNLQDFILRNASKLIKNSVEAVEAYRITAQTGDDPDEIAALAALVSSTAGAIEVVNKINALNKKIKATKQIKEMEIDARAKLMENRVTGNTTNNNTTNVLVATREEIVKALLKGGKDDKVIDVDVKQIEG